MAHVITDKCVNCKYTECFAVCPVECFHQRDEMLLIDPAVCIDCGACIPACPVAAIFADSDVPDDQKEWIQFNAEQAPALPLVTAKMEPLGPPVNV